MRVLFIVPNLTGDFYRAMYPHIGIAYMISILESEGHKTDVIDMRIHSKFGELDKRIGMFHPDMIGITLMSRDYLKSYRFVNFVKKRYGKKIIIGGPHITLFKEEALKNCEADYAINGEGEYAILALANKDDPARIKNLIWKRDCEIIKNEVEYIKDLDSLPFPDYTKFPLHKYIDRKIPIVTSRGCPFNCIYCSIGNLMGKQWRARSTENIIKEIELWKKRGYNFFQITDDNFTLNRKRVEAFCSKIIEKKLDLKWELRNGIRADTVDEKLLCLMKQAGCIFVAYGIESLDQDVLNASKKGLLVEDAEKAVQASIKLGIKTGAFFIIGLPKDNFKKFTKILRFIKKYDLDEIEIYNCLPYPKTELEAWIKGNGKFIYRPNDYLNFASYWKNDIIFETPEFSSKERKYAFRVSEKIVLKKLLKKEIGKPLATIAYPFWMNKALRKIFLNTGLSLWKSIRIQRQKRI